MQRREDGLIIIVSGKSEDMEKLIEEDLPGLPIVQVILQWPSETPTQKANSQVVLETIKAAAKKKGCVVDYDSEHHA